jgi:hypothetical protein
MMRYFKPTGGMEMRFRTWSASGILESMLRNEQIVGFILCENRTLN